MPKTTKGKLGTYSLEITDYTKEPGANHILIEIKDKAGAKVSFIQGEKYGEIFRIGRYHLEQALPRETRRAITRNLFRRLENYLGPRTKIQVRTHKRLGSFLKKMGNYKIIGKCGTSIDVEGIKTKSPRKQTARKNPRRRT